MTTATETVECPKCHTQVAPTRPGGTRPRDHNDSDGNPCAGPREAFRLDDCPRCGKPAHERGCGSALHHPETWLEPTGEPGKFRRVGNAAAAGEIVKVSGQQYQWLARVPPKGPRRAPEHLGIRRDGVRFYDLEAVAEYVKHRPGPGGHAVATSAE